MQDCIEKLRGLVGTEVLADSTLGVALTNVADQLDSHERGMAAVVERVEALERAVLPRGPEDVGRL